MVVLLFLSFAACTALLSGEKVLQTPSDMLKNTGETATIQCSHSITGYDVILWYKNVDVQMQPLGYMSYSNALPEKGVDVEIKGSASVNEQCRLIVPKLNLNSSAFYYCAASYHAAALSCPINFAACTALLSGEKVLQTPGDIIEKTGETATIQCSHNVTSYDVILWYKNVDVQMQLLGYLYNRQAFPEKGVDVEIKGSASVNEQCQLIVPKLNLNSKSIQSHEELLWVVTFNMKPQSSALIVFITHVLCTAGVKLSQHTKVSQTPHTVFGRENDQVTLSFSHAIQNYDTILWYQRSTETTNLKLIASVNYKAASVEVPLGGHFNVSGDEPDRVPQPPKVTLLKPSPQECSQQKKKKKKTLVCVATGFYPDHVSVVWQVNQVQEDTGVATDLRALRSGDYYSISSRLRVPSSQWFNSHTTFKCVVNFFNGKESVGYEAEMKGEKGWDQEDAMTRDNFLKIWQSAKLSYSVLIAKSCVYAAFLFFLLRKLPLGLLGEK
ncbi:uncharacterized protein LOC133640898 [Entelurus aequoreus]|uniref:uncharacterized protein LOC133640898 n=1 Tax=Entelurus aequoreus TaxID=161455 RepID=UPI002B1CFA95|nr:uncharacterized protein LOC133640898 [Entelurus aequoreus]